MTSRLAYPPRTWCRSLRSPARAWTDWWEGQHRYRSASCCARRCGAPWHGCRHAGPARLMRPGCPMRACPASPGVGQSEQHSRSYRADRRHGG
ncbi:hypothetical protein J2S66_001937 [Saccharothrix longispora]|uniref:Uncharacterized protein n=1 Tax=Saccharothrix longispora TaxID=33920 RepID=A0ABU1PSD2_9PSEU|nr:hypothetical protein [Saccharothrix longispora]